jgi:hypothetical protein
VATQQGILPPAPSPATERLGVGGAIGIIDSWTIGSVRLSVPIDAKLAIDVDAGHHVGSSSADIRIPAGFAFSTQFRWLWHDREASGHSGYWLAGPLFFAAPVYVVHQNSPYGPLVDSPLQVDNWIKTVQFGYGWDWLRCNGTRAGIEVKSGAPTTFLVNGFVVLGPR